MLSDLFGWLSTNGEPSADEREGFCPSTLSSAEGVCDC
jgi:hypothetical protein